MKIRISGDHPAVPLLQGYLRALGYKLAADASEARVTHALHVKQSTLSNIAVRGVRSPLLEEAIRMIGELASTSVEWFPASGDAESVIHVSAPDFHADAIGRGLLRALIRATQREAATSPRWFAFVSNLWKWPSNAD